MPDQSTFAARHIGPDSQALAAMLAVIGVDSLDELASKAVPTGIFDKLTDSGAAPGLEKLPPPASEAPLSSVVIAHTSLVKLASVDDSASNIVRLLVGSAAVTAP